MDKIRPEKLTLKKLAVLAGVSHKTISRVINDEAYVKEETRKNVLEIIEKYNYQPNFFAKVLRTKQSKTIGLVLGDINNPFYSSLADGVTKVCKDEGYDVIVTNTAYATDIGDRYIKVLLGKGVDGLIITTINLYEEALREIRINIPFILVSWKSDFKNINYVTADDYNGGVLAAEYLTDLGHKDIYFLKIADVFSAGERVRAFKDVMNKCKINFNEQDISKPLINENGSYEEVKKVLESSNKYTAFIAGNDYLAIGAMRAIFEKGLRIPEDISLIGYDNIPISSLLSVPLTTIDQPKYELGEIGAKRLIEMLKDPLDIAKPMEKVLPTKLIIRESCKKINS